MRDTIYRDEAIKAIKDNSFALGDDYMEINGYGAIDDIRALPSVDRPNSVDLTNVYTVAYKNGYKQGKAEMYEHMKNRLDDEYDAGYCTGKADRPQGEWKPFDLTWGRSIYACSVCEEAIAVPCGWSDGKPIYDYCPMCGARMKGADDGNK